MIELPKAPKFSIIKSLEALHISTKNVTIWYFNK